MTLKKHIAILISLLLLASIAFLGFMYFADNALEQFPDSTQVNFNLSSGDVPINVSYFDKISERVKTKYFSFTSEAEPVYLKDSEVTPVYTTYSYFDLTGKELAGLSFTEKDQKSAKKKVIISDSLALRLYFNKDAVGRILEFEGEKYIVCGVFADRKKLTDEFSKDGKERIYIPYTLADSPEELPVHTIVYDTHSSTAPVMEQMNIEQYHYTSLSEKALVIGCLKHILFLLLYAGSAAVLLYFWYKILNRLIKEIGDNLKENYFIKSLASVPLKYLLLIVIGLGVPALLLFIFLRSDFSIYIVPEYIPGDNLFDVNHYINCLIENAHAKNSLALSGDTYLSELYYSAFSACLWLGLIFLIFYIFVFVALFSLFKKLITNNTYCQRLSL